MNGSEFNLFRTDYAVAGLRQKGFLHFVRVAGLVLLQR